MFQLPTKPEAKRDVITFGETMLRLCPPGFGRLEDATHLEVSVGGTESNTAVALAKMGRSVAWWSRLPANPLGRRVEAEIRRWGVDTSGVQWDADGSRLGIMMLNAGPEPRGTDVYYDRAGSAASRICPHDVDVEAIASARILHLTGITCALSEECRQAIEHAVSAARRSETAISLDLNYRARLWSAEDARRALEPILPMIDCLFVTAEDARRVLGALSDDGNIADELRRRWGCGLVIATRGGDGIDAAFSGGGLHADPHAIGRIVDRIGAGDACSAGILTGLLEGSLERGLALGSALAALKHTIPGDLCIVERQEVERLADTACMEIRR